jgi:hypothetical protein
LLPRKVERVVFNALPITSGFAAWLFLYAVLDEH